MSQIEKVDQKINDAIEKMAEKVKQLYGIETPIHNMNDTVKKLEGELVINYSKGAYEAYIGRMDLPKDTQFKIVLRDNSNEEINWLAAVQLGHLFLDMKYRINLYEWKKWEDQNTRALDIHKIHKATIFASEFLMPADEYKIILLKNQIGDCVDTASVAKHFNVPIRVAAFRGVKLGLLRAW